jgi:hypothetical protein
MPLTAAADLRSVRVLVRSIFAFIVIVIRSREGLGEGGAG